MTEEEEKAIDYLTKYINWETQGERLLEKDIGTALSLIKKLQKEVDILKNKVHYKNCEACGKEFRAKRSDAKYCTLCSKIAGNRNYYLGLSNEQRNRRREQAKLSMQRTRQGRRKENELLGSQKS